MDTFEFIEKARKVHGEEYGYVNTKFVNWKTKVIITCREHGDFETSPSRFIYRKHGCPKCRGKHISATKRKTQQEFMEDCLKVHGNNYDYSKAVYNGSDNEVEIICPKHGSFFQTPYNHVKKKCGCPSCRYDVLSAKFKLTDETLMSRVKEIHGERYSYPKLFEEYQNNRSLITIVCPQHGEFKQSLMKHLLGHGCPLCNESHLEREVAKVLTQEGIDFEREKTFEWLTHEKQLYLDFYLPKHNIAIECQGEQHFKPVEHFGGEAEFSEILKRDKVKTEKCREHGIKILLYSKEKNMPNSYFDTIYSNNEKLLKEILEYGNNRGNSTSI